MYSTCTLFEEENGKVINSLLSKVNSDGEVCFTLEHISAVDKIDSGKYKGNDGSVQILPHREYDGFYIARLIKK